MPLLAYFIGTIIILYWSNSITCSFPYLLRLKRSSFRLNKFQLFLIRQFAFRSSNRKTADEAIRWSIYARLYIPATRTETQRKSQKTRPNLPERRVIFPRQVSSPRIRQKSPLPIFPREYTVCLSWLRTPEHLEKNFGRFYRLKIFLDLTYKVKQMTS